MNRIYQILIFILPILNRGFSQPQAPSLANLINVDLSTWKIDELPFDMPFFFVGKLDKDWKIDRLQISIAKGRTEEGASFFNIADEFSTAGKSQFYIPFLPQGFETDYLLPDRDYMIKFVCKDKDGNILPSYSFTYGVTVRSKIGDHTKLDFGLAYVPLTKALAGFTSVNIYFTPINDETNLKRISSIRRNIFLRTSIFLGISPITLVHKAKQPVKNRFAAGNFIFGIAIRSPFYGFYTKGIGRVGQKLLQPMRLSVGQILFAQANANPLIKDEVNKSALYLGLSYDINIASLLGPVNKLLAP